MLQVKDGESLLVMGPSGVGKTSVLRAIAGLWSSGSGTITRLAVIVYMFADMISSLTLPAHQTCCLPQAALVFGMYACSCKERFGADMLPSSSELLLSEARTTLYTCNICAWHTQSESNLA